MEEGRVEAGTACPGEAQDHAEEGQGQGVDPGEVVVVEVREAPTNPTPKDKNLHPIPSIKMVKTHGILLKA